MDTGSIVAVVVAGIGGLSTFAAGVWYASSLFSAVKSNGRTITVVDDTLNELQGHVEEHAKTCDADRIRYGEQIRQHEGTLSSHDHKITKHGERIVKIETQVKNDGA